MKTLVSTTIYLSIMKIAHELRSKSGLPHYPTRYQTVVRSIRVTHCRIARTTRWVDCRQYDPLVLDRSQDSYHF